MCLPFRCTLVVLAYYRVAPIDVRGRCPFSCFLARLQPAGLARSAARDRTALAAAWTTARHLPDCADSVPFGHPLHEVVISLASMMATPAVFVASDHAVTEAGGAARFVRRLVGALPENGWVSKHSVLLRLFACQPFLTVACVSGTALVVTG